MRALIWLLVFCANACWCIQTVSAQRATPELWLAPLQPLVRPDGTDAGSADYFNMFAPEAAWQTVAGHATVFQIYPELLRSASDADLQRMGTWLDSHGIALGLETKILTRTAWCVAGNAHRPWMVNLIGRLKRLGLNLQRVAMVGPLVDGHVATGYGACQRSIVEVADDAANTVRLIREMFPNVAIGEIEPIGGGPGFLTAAEFAEWLNAFSKASGHQIAFLHVDAVWGTSWHDNLRAIAGQARAFGVPFGIIAKGGPTNLSDASFAKAALSNFDDLEVILGEPPQHIIVQSWQDYPRHALPDADPTTLTGIARLLLRPRSVLSAGNDGRVRLTNRSGQPIAGAELAVSINRPGPNVELVPQTLDGVVPRSATQARFGLRVHTECACSEGAVNLTLSHFSFQQAGYRAVEWDMKPWARAKRTLAGTDEIRVLADPGEKVVLNGPLFPVAADQPFVAQFRWHVGSQGDGAGFATIVFSNSDGKEVRRTVQQMKPTWQPITTMHVGRDGTALLPPATSTPGTVLRVHYTGDSEHRPTDLLIDGSS